MSLPSATPENTTTPQGYLALLYNMTHCAVQDRSESKSKSWLSKVFLRMFVCHQKKKKKGLKRYVSFRSIQLKTPNQDENENVYTMFNV